MGSNAGSTPQPLAVTRVAERLVGFQVRGITTWRGACFERVMQSLRRSSLFVPALSVAIFGMAALAACSGGTSDSLLNGRSIDPNAAAGDSANASAGMDAGAKATSSGGTSGASGTSGTSGTSGASGATEDGGTSPVPPDGGAPAPGGGAPPPPVATDAFTGAGAFVAQSGPSAHNAGQSCMGGCHDHGFTFAGTLSDAAGAAVSSAEVRLVDANGQAILVHSGPNGNFYSSTPWVPPARVAARTSTSKVVMVTALATAANGGCNGCHATGGTVPKIHVP